MRSVVLPCSCSILITVHIGALDVRLWHTSFSLLLHVFASLAVNCCWLQSKMVRGGDSWYCLICVACIVVRSALRMDLACWLIWSWRLSCLHTSQGSHQSSLTYSVTAWMQATWAALTLSRTTPYGVVRVWSLASVCVAFFVHWLCCFLNVRCASINTPSLDITGVSNQMIHFLTLIFGVCWGWKCVLWPCLHVNSTASVIAA